MHVCVPWQKRTPDPLGLPHGCWGLNQVLWKTNGTLNYLVIFLAPVVVIKMGSCPVA